MGNKPGQVYESKYMRRTGAQDDAIRGSICGEVSLREEKPAQHLVLTVMSAGAGVLVLCCITAAWLL